MTKWGRLDGERMTLRPVTTADADALLEILREPEVSRWWVDYTAERVRDELIEPGDGLAIDIGGRVSGAVLLYPNHDPEYLHTVIHLFLGAEWYGQRYGAEALSIAIRHLATLGHHRFTLDPNVANAPAIRSYERLGFRRVGILRQYQLRESGEWEDGLLMDLVMSDFPEGVDWRRG